MNIVQVDNLEHPLLADFTQLTDVELRRVREPAEGLFLAESEKVITRAITAGYKPRAFLLTREWLEGLRPMIEPFHDVPVFLADEVMLERITGFHLHRGAIASMHRPKPLDAEHLLHAARTVVVLDNLADHTNVGAIFRSVAALGADVVLLSPSCADPLYRRAVRVSMGAVLEIPWARFERWRDAERLLNKSGFTVMGFGFGEDSIDLRDALKDRPERIAMVFGAEGPGLSRQALRTCEKLVRIPMDRGIDSLNVATAAGIALWALRT